MTPPIRRRLVGNALRQYREDLGYRLDDAARVLECDRSKISRIESGMRGIRPKELRELLTEYRVPDAAQQVLLHLASRPDQGWWEAYPRVLAPQLLEYCTLEAAAAEIMIYDPQMIPSLLQTSHYAKVIARAHPRYWPGHETELAATCTVRHKLILDGSRQVSIIVGEAAIRQQAGGLQVMGEQLEHLAALDPRVSVQVVPFTAGAHAASGSPGFALLRFGPVPGPAVVFVPALSGGFFTSEQDEVSCYLQAFTQLRTGALTAADTARLLSEAAAPWD